ncbi:CRTAC1 family protein, partial [bacterium]
YLNSGTGTFVLASSTTLEGRGGMSWSGLLEDLDLDGSEDLFLVNGFYPDTLFFHDEVKLLRFGVGDGSFRAAPAGNGADFLGTSRASLSADFDRDGCPDLLVTGLHGPRLLRGLCPDARASLRLRLAQPAPNPDAVGARVELSAGGRRRVLRWGPYGGGQLSSFWGERLVGLGAGREAEAVTVTWPGGARETFGPLTAGELAVLRRGAGRKADDGRR